MRIADVSPRADSIIKGGMQARVNGILSRLGERHEVRRFNQPRWGVQLAKARAHAPPRPNTSAAAALIGELSQFTWPSAPLATGLALRLTRPPRVRELLDWADVALVEFPWQYAYCARVAPPGLPLVLGTHNVEAAKFKSYAEGLGVGVTAWPWLRYVERMERRAFQSAPLVFAVSESDRDGLLARYGGDPAKVVVAPNGADVEALTPTTPERRAAARREFGLADRPVVLFIGTPTPPNVLALKWVEKLARASDRFTFLAVGRVTDPPGRHGNLIRAGEIEDLQLCFDAADVSLVAIGYGGGTKLKLIESLAAAKPTVAFRKALEGLDVHDGRHLLVAEQSVDAILAAVGMLVDDPLLGERLGAEGRRYVEQNLAWPPIVDTVERALLELVASREARPRAAPLSAALRG